MIYMHVTFYNIMLSENFNAYIFKITPCINFQTYNTNSVIVKNVGMIYKELILHFVNFVAYKYNSIYVEISEKIWCKAVVLK